VGLNFGRVAAIIGTSLFTVGDTASKLVSERFGNRVASLDVLGIGLIPALAWLILFGAGAGLNTYQCGLVILAAALLGSGYLLIYKSLETEQVSNIWVLFESSSIILVLLGAVFLSERLSMIEMASMLAIFFGALLVTTDTKLRVNRKLVPAIIGSLLWGLSNIPIVYAIQDSHGFVMPILLERLLAFAVIDAYLMAVGKRRSAMAKAIVMMETSDRKTVAATAISGICDGMGMLAVGYVFLSNVVALGGALFALEPAFIMLLGRVFYRDRLTRLQLIGSAVMIIGAVALSV